MYHDVKNKSNDYTFTSLLCKTKNNYDENILQQYQAAQQETQNYKKQIQEFKNIAGWDYLIGGEICPLWLTGFRVIAEWQDDVVYLAKWPRVI